MALTMSRIDRTSRQYTASAAQVNGSPAVITGLDVALLPKGADPTAATVWTPTTYANGVGSILLAGPDADSTGALVVTATCDLWIRITDAPDVKAVKFERITVLDTSGTVTALPSTYVTSINGMSGPVVLTFSDVGADAAGAASTSQSFAVQRANHTGTQSAATITGLATVATSGAYADLSGRPTVLRVSARLAQTTIGLGSYSGIPAAIDGVVPSVGDVVMLTAETASVNNGPWVIQSGAWMRPTTYPTGADAYGALVSISDGNSNPGSLFVSLGNGPLLVDTAGTTWRQIRQGVDRGFVTAFSVYNVGDVAILGNLRVLMTKAVQASSTATISSGNFVVLGYLQVADIRTFGALVDGTTDDTTAIQNAINSFGTQGTSTRGTGGVVYFPPGTTRISATLDVPSNVHLRGAGWAASVIQLLANSNCDAIRLHKSTVTGTNSNAFWSSVRDLMIDGRYVPNGTRIQGTTVSDVTLGAAGTTTISSAGSYTFNVGDVVQGIGLMSGTTITAVGAPATSATLSQPLLNTVAQNGTAGTATVLVGGDASGRPWTAIYHETNPYSSAAGADNQFDPSHLIRDVWIYAWPGDGIRVKGRSDIQIDHVKVSFPQGSGFVIDFDTAITNSMVEKSVGHSLWLAGHSSNRITNCKFYNSYGYGIYGQGAAGVGEITLTGVDIQQSNSHGLYLQGYTVPVICQGVTVAQSGFSNASGSVASGQDIAAVVLDGVTGSIVDVACANNPVALKVINSSAKNDVRITSTSNVSGARDLSINNQASLGTNRIFVNAAIVNPVPTLTALTGDVNITSPADTQILQYDSASGKWKNAANGGGSPVSYGNVFGDGSDGTVTLDGTVTVAGITKSGSVYTLARDFFFVALTVNSGVTLNTNGFRVFATTTVTNAGTIAANGNAGNANGTAGVAVNTAAMLASSAGGAGNTGAGTAGPNTGARLGVGTGGAGGAGGTGAAGGAGFNNSGNTYMLRPPQVALTTAVGYGGTVSQLSGGSGGGGGGGDATNKGGGGGSGGGVVVVLAHAIVNSGSITATGGAGGTPTTGNAGGGGGGGGGLVLLYSLAAWTNTGTTSVLGGAAGAGAGTGAAGNAGTAGNVVNFVVS